MKLTSDPTLHATLLLVILSFYACSLVTDVDSLRSSRDQLESGQTRELVFRDPAGITVEGIRVDTASLPAKIYIAFLLRNHSIQDDLRFWTRAHSLLGSRPGTVLVGYCDGQSCAKSLNTLQKPPFIVLAYAEAVSVQAVANADAKGFGLLKVPGSATISKIAWRGENASPDRVMGEVIR